MAGRSLGLEDVIVSKLKMLAAAKAAYATSLRASDPDQADQVQADAVTLHKAATILQATAEQDRKRNAG